MALELRIPRRLESPNIWNGRHWRVKHRITQEWEKEICCAARFSSRAALAHWQTHGHAAAERKARIEVERHVPSGRNFIRDDDNLRFSVKPLLDALKRQGYIRNDSRMWLEHPTPTQHVSADGKDWTVIRIAPAEKE